VPNPFPSLNQPLDAIRRDMKVEGMAEAVAGCRLTRNSRRAVLIALRNSTLLRLNSVPAVRLLI
jgi:hypothetical protein